MTAEELLLELEAEGVRLSIRGDRLVLDAPTGVLTQKRLDEIRAFKPELLAIVADHRAEKESPEGAPDAFEEIVADALRFQEEGKPGPWGAFTMSGDELEGVIGDLHPAQRGDLDIRIGIYRRDGLPDDQGRRIALFLLAGEHDIPLDGT